MVISEEHRFVFVHIPKCAGSSVRRRLFCFNEGLLVGPPWIRNHSKLGLLYIGHVPLFVLREYFSHEFETVQNYWSFCVVRNPFDRFASSVPQRTREYNDRPIEKLSTKEIRLFINETIEYLSQHQQVRSLLPSEYIHFQRQIDYIELDGERIIDSIYTVDQIDELFTDVEIKLGQKLAESAGQAKNNRANQTIVFRNNFLRRSIEISRPLTNYLSKVLPESTKQTIRDHVYVPRDKRLKDIFEEDHVQAFIRNYYKDDIALYKSVLETAHCEVP